MFMISVAAELAEMHPQTLRMYEARGLITPKRSPKNTRLYSQADVERLRRIQRMTNEEGLNLAGVETVLEMEASGRAHARRDGADAKARRRDGEADERGARAPARRARRRDRPLRGLRAPSSAPTASRRPGPDPQRAASAAERRSCRSGRRPAPAARRLGQQPVVIPSSVP